MAITLDGTAGITLPESGNVNNIDLIKSSTSSPTIFQDTSGTEIGTLCRAWVNFDGTTTPPSIRASFNVSSVTRGATGQYVITLTNALSDVNGCVVSQARLVGVGSGYSSSYIDSTSTIQVNTLNTAGTLTNANQTHVAVFR